MHQRNFHIVTQKEHFLRLAVFLFFFFSYKIKFDINVLGVSPSLFRSLSLDVMRFRRFSMTDAEVERAVEKPIRSFGIITDIHYGDLDDRWNFSKTFIRHYRNSLQLVRQANAFWAKSPHSIDFILQLGDLIDGFCQGNGTSEGDLQTILNEFLRLSLIHI